MKVPEIQRIYRKNNFAEILKNLDIDMKIILFCHQNNCIENQE